MKRQDVNKLGKNSTVVLNNGMEAVITGGPAKMQSWRGQAIYLDETVYVFEAICDDGKMRYISNLDIRNFDAKKSARELLEGFREIEVTV